MITNLPSYDSLNNSALRSHYMAWETLLDVIQDFYDFHSDNPDESEVTWHLEWREYLDKSRFELERILTDLAAANELALRARICSVSPFLLLLNTENRFKKNDDNIDFTELRTIDAVDLPSLHNGVCDTKLNDNFLQEYNWIRSLRNKITHLGSVEMEFDHERLISLACNQYVTLWDGLHWLPNWIEHTNRRRISHFFDYKNHSESTDVMYLIPTITEQLSKSQFKNLFGFPKNKRRYICHECCYTSCIERHGVYLGDYKTAHLVESNLLYCSMCETELKVERDECGQKDCDGNVIFSSESFAPSCCTCGMEQGYSQPNSDTSS